MAAARNLNLDDFENPKQIKNFIDEDINQVGSMLHTFYDCRGKEFVELDRFLSKNHESMNSYFKYLEKDYSFDINSEDSMNSFDPRQFIRKQKAHIDELEKIGCPQSLRIIEFKKSFIL